MSEVSSAIVDSIAEPDTESSTPYSSIQLRERWKQWLALGVSTAAFAAALATRRDGNVWLGVSIASVIAIAASLLAGGWRPMIVEPPKRLAINAVIGVVGGAIMALLTHALVPPTLDLIPRARTEVYWLYENLQDPPGPVWALPVLAFAVLAEELVWRGVAMDILDYRRHPFRAAIFAAGLYAIPQVASGSWLLVVLALGCGLVWSALRAWRESLIAPALTHFVWNLVVFVFWPLHAAVPTPV